MLRRPNIGMLALAAANLHCLSQPTTTEKIEETVEKLKKLAPPEPHAPFHFEVPSRAYEIYRPTSPAKHRHGSVGRNERCPCGSGRKFKNCCS